MKQKLQTARLRITTMMMMIKRITLVFCLVLPAVLSNGQDADFGIWPEFNTEFRLLKRLNACTTMSLRTFNNSSQVEQGFAEAGLQYKLIRNLSVAGSYRLIKEIEDDSKYYYRHKIFLDLKYSVPVRNLTVSARFRMQRTAKTYIEDKDDLLAGYCARVKLKSEYDIPSSLITPFIYVESFTPLFTASGFEISKYRAAAGAEVKINRHSSLEIGYLYQREFKKEIVTSHIILLSYNLKF